MTCTSGDCHMLKMLLSTMVKYELQVFLYLNVDNKNKGVEKRSEEGSTKMNKRITEENLYFR